MKTAPAPYPRCRPRRLRQADWSRRLVRENHPDTLVAQGLPAEFVEVADRKLAAINAAYAEVKARRNLR